MQGYSSLPQFSRPVLDKSERSRAVSSSTEPFVDVNVVNVDSVLPAPWEFAVPDDADSLRERALVGGRVVFLA